MLLRIGEFARMTKVSVKMLRHYDRIGLLRPARVDESTGYRYYTATQLPRLNRILMLRDLGFGLRDIAKLVDAGCEELLDERERQLLATLAAAEAQLRAVRGRRAVAVDALDVVVRATPRTLVAACAAAPCADSFDRLERYVASFGARLSAPPMTLIGPRIVIAVPLSRPVPERDGVELRRLPAVTRMACAVHLGGVDGVAATWHAMMRWLDATGERVDGELREVYLRFGADPALRLPGAYLADGETDLVTEVQAPLAPASSR